MSKLFLETMSGKVKLVEGTDLLILDKYIDLTKVDDCYVSSSKLPEDERCCTEPEAIKLDIFYKVKSDELVDRGLFKELKLLCNILPDLKIHIETFTFSSNDIITKDNIIEKEVEFLTLSNSNIAEIRLYRDINNKDYYVPKDKNSIMSMCHKLIIFNMSSKTIRIKFDTMVSIKMSKIVR